MKKSTRLLAAALTLGATSMFLPKAHAAANGDGVCQANETANSECAVLGPAVLEFLGSTAASQCKLDDNTFAPCTAYYYRYSGAAANQLNVAIPARNTRTFNSATEIGCQQFLTGGAGDPTTGFGRNQRSLGICRVAKNLNAAPIDATVPPGANLVLTVDPSAYDSKNPLDWQLKKGSNQGYDDDDEGHGNSSSGLFAASLLGPFSTQPDVTESAVTLTTPAGASVSYTNLGGNIRIVSGNARVVPQGSTKLCIVKPGGNPAVPYTSPDFKLNWDCETITFATEQCDIKTSGSDPCRMIGGTCIQF